MNLLIITADDLSYMATGIGGCEIKQITPNIDDLANNGVYFDNAHTTVGLCQPARSVLMTGLYPWNNGAFGFEPIKEGTETLVTILKKQGYRCGIIGKESHLAPRNVFQWDYVLSERDLQGGKIPRLYYNPCKEFFAQSKPFFLLVNSHDPHRDFPSRYKYDICDVKVPCFLDDNEVTRKEISQYYTAVNRCDETVGMILKALKESDVEDVMVIFTSDHGMAFPFVKANCYHFSSKIPLVFSHPSFCKNKDSEHMVSGVDFMPTILEIMGITHNCPLDGKSYYDVLHGKKQLGRDMVYTCLCKNFSGVLYETRAIHSKEFCYIRNFWSDGINIFFEDGCLENQKSYCSLPQSKKTHIRYRLPEEFYHLKDDPCAQNNLIENVDIEYIRQIMKNIAKKHKDRIASSMIHPNPSRFLL